MQKTKTAKAQKAQPKTAAKKPMKSLEAVKKFAEKKYGKK